MNISIRSSLTFSLILSNMRSKLIIQDHHLRFICAIIILSSSIFILSIKSFEKNYKQNIWKQSHICHSINIHIHHLDSYSKRWIIFKSIDISYSIFLSHQGNQLMIIFRRDMMQYSMNHLYILLNLFKNMIKDVKWSNMISNLHFIIFLL